MSTGCPQSLQATTLPQAVDRRLLPHPFQISMEQSPNQPALHICTQFATSRQGKAPFRSAAFQDSTAVRKQRATRGSTDGQTDRLQLRRRRVVMKQQATLPTYRCDVLLSAATNTTVDIHRCSDAGRLEKTPRQDKTCLRSESDELSNSGGPSDSV